MFSNILLKKLSDYDFDKQSPEQGILYPKNSEILPLGPSEKKKHYSNFDHIHGGG